MVDAWTAIANPAAIAGPVLVADWGGGWDGLDAAETLAEQGAAVTLACAAPAPGWTLQQYQRNLYLARFDERGIPILHHTEVLGDRLRHLFSGREHRIPDVATIVFAHGRVPEDALWAELEGRRATRPRRRRPRPPHRRGGHPRGHDRVLEPPRPDNPGYLQHLRDG